MSVSSYFCSQFLSRRICYHNSFVPPDLQIQRDGIYKFIIHQNLHLGLQSSSLILLM